MLLGYLSGSYDATTNEFAFAAMDGSEIPADGFSIEELVGHKFYLANNDIMFEKDTDSPLVKKYKQTFITEQNAQLEELEVVGILRVKDNVEGILSTGISYMPELTKKLLEKNSNSSIVKDTIGNKVIINGTEYSDCIIVDSSVMTLRSLAGVNTPSDISIYAKDFNSKEKIKNYIDAWNDGKEESDKDYIAYSDMMSMMFGMLNTMVDAVTYVLVAFTSISLIVSSVMIGIITYISVVERTKEIGVLRALGAAKREISNVFNAETFLIGLFSGLIGVGVTYLLSLPINIILKSLIPSVGKLAVLHPLAALVMVCISVLLTLVAGLIPAGAAAKKDPVVALRSE